MSRPREWTLVATLEIELSYEPQPGKQEEWKCLAVLQADVSYKPRGMDVGC